MIEKIDLSQEVYPEYAFKALADKLNEIIEVVNVIQATQIKHLDVTVRELGELKLLGAVVQGIIEP